MKIKDHNYYTITGWMINKLKLSGTELQIFAIIYSFTQDYETEFSGSRQYMAEFTGATKPTIDKAIKGLLEKNLIIKIQYIENKVKYNKYKLNNLLELYKIYGIEGSKKILPPSKETLQGGSKETLQGGSKETLQYKEVLYLKNLLLITNLIQERMNYNINESKMSSEIAMKIANKLDEGIIRIRINKAIDEYPGKPPIFILSKVEQTL